MYVYEGVCIFQDVEVRVQLLMRLLNPMSSGRMLLSEWKNFRLLFQFLQHYHNTSYYHHTSVYNPRLGRRLVATQPIFEPKARQWCTRSIIMRSYTVNRKLHGTVMSRAVVLGTCTRARVVST